VPRQLFPRADLSVVLIFFLAYSMALVSGGMLTSAFFSKAKVRKYDHDHC